MDNRLKSYRILSIITLFLLTVMSLTFLGFNLYHVVEIAKIVGTSSTLGYTTMIAEVVSCVLLFVSAVVGLVVFIYSCIKPTNSNLFRRILYVLVPMLGAYIAFYGYYLNGVIKEKTLLINAVMNISLLGLVFLISFAFMFPKLKKGHMVFLGILTGVCFAGAIATSISINVVENIFKHYDKLSLYEAIVYFVLMFLIALFMFISSLTYKNQAEVKAIQSVEVPQQVQIPTLSKEEELKKEFPDSYFAIKTEPSVEKSVVHSNPEEVIIAAKSIKEEIDPNEALKDAQSRSQATLALIEYTRLEEKIKQNAIDRKARLKAEAEAQIKLALEKEEEEKEEVMPEVKERVKLICLPRNLPYISDHMFAKNTQLQIANIPDYITILGPGCFANCYNLLEIYIPASVKKIGYNAFFNCKRVTKVGYAGTMKEFEQIERESNWATRLGTSTIQCSDGDYKI